MHEEQIELFGFSMRKEAFAAWIFRVLVFVAVIWSSSTFVTKSSYESDKKDSEARREMVLNSVASINNTLIRIDEKMKNDDRQDHEIADHEVRLRNLEHNK